MKVFFAVFGAMAAVLAAIIYMTFSWGYVATVLYKWFILSTFDGLPNIAWWQFAGIMFFVNCFIRSDLHYFKEEVRDTNKGFVASLFLPWSILVMAWLFKVIVL